MFLSLGGWFFYPVYPVYAYTTTDISTINSKLSVTSSLSSIGDDIRWFSNGGLRLSSTVDSITSFTVKIQNTESVAQQITAFIGTSTTSYSAQETIPAGYNDFKTFTFPSAMTIPAGVDFSFAIFNSGSQYCNNHWCGLKIYGGPTTGDSNYFVGFPFAQDSTVKEGYININAVPAYYSTDFTTFSPANASSTGQSVSFVQNYTNNSTSSPYGIIGIQAWWASQNFNQIFNSTSTISTGAGSFSVATALVNNQNINWRGYMYSTTTDSYFYSDMHYFTVGADPWPSMIGTTTSAIYTLATSTCGITNISGCFQNAIVWAFYPSQGSLDQFIGLKDEVIRKPPFGYFALISSAFNGLSDTGTPLFSLATSPDVMTSIFNPLKNGIAFAMWILFGVWLIKTFSHLNI